MNFSMASGALLSLALASSAAAPATAQPSDLPSYATREETVHGRIATVVDAHHITLYDDRGFVDNVTLRDGSEIDPPGLTLAPGQIVTIYGHADGPTLVATQIDASAPEGDAGGYSEDDSGAYPAPYAGPDPYAYGPYDPYGPYGYFGPSFGIGLGFGFYGGGYGGHHGYGHGYGYGHGHGYGGYGHGGYGHGSGGHIPLARGAASAGGHAGRR